ncbi:MAG: hypothetical protein ABFS42_09270, partial [Candidatus Krumholzibacteriota bacterium]
MAIAGKHLASHAWRDGCCITASFTTDGRVAFHSFGFGPAQFAFSRIGFHCHFAGFFVNMDLHRRPPGEGPPGGLFLRFH